MNIKISMPLLVLLPVLAVTACLSSPQPGDSASFSIVERKEIIPSARTKNHAELLFSLVDVSQKGTLQKQLRKILYNGKSAETYLRLFTAEWKKAYNKAENERKTNLQWSYEEAHNLALTGSFAVIKRNTAVYKGDVHPDWHEKTYVIDLSVPVRQIFLKDIFTKEGIEKLSALADRELRRFSQIKTGRTLSPGTPLSRGIYSQDTVNLPENFYPAANGITFRWDPGEIAPSNEGAIEISLRWNEVNEHLSAKGRELAKMFNNSR